MGLNGVLRRAFALIIAWGPFIFATEWVMPFFEYPLYTPWMGPLAALAVVLLGLAVSMMIPWKMNRQNDMNVHVVSRWDRLVCRVFGHAWVPHASTGRLSSCIRCVRQHPNAGPEAEPQDEGRVAP